MEIEGIKYISNPRPNRRGGGAAITLLEGDFTLSRLDVITPKCLEVVWGIVKPKEPTTQFKGIIVCSFYSVPNSRKKTQLIEHIALNYSQLKVTNKDCFFVMGGDKNDLDLRQLLAISPTFHMMNTKPTYGSKNIDVLISDFAHLYSDSVIQPNVPTDLPAGRQGGGQPSDHPVVYVRPRVDRLTAPKREVITKKMRRVDDDKKKKVAGWIQHESWDSVTEAGSASGMASQFTQLVHGKLDEICPVTEVKVSQFHGELTSPALQNISRLKLREYTNNGNSQQFKALKKRQKARIAFEAKQRLEKEIENAGGRGMRWMREANRLTARPGDDQSSTFTLPTHVDRNLTPKESAEEIAKYFSKISQEYPPIEEDPVSEQLGLKLSKDPCEHPALWEHEIYRNMEKSKKTDTVPGDIPAAILKEFLPEFAKPVTEIIKKSIESHSWPEMYKKEHHVPLKKCPKPETEDDVRGIGLTPWVSKQLERVVLQWIWPYIQPHLDPDQMGGMPGCSVEHYIIKMVDFILKSMDGDSNAAVIALPVDYSKAFNRMRHSNILNSLETMNVPTCAIKLIKSYLTQRSMCVRYRGKESTFHSLPGGGPQGGLLTSILFCVQVNKAGSPCTPASRQPVTLPPNPASRQPVALPPCHRADKLNKEAYIDDLTLLEKISLKDLELKERTIGPPNFHDRHHLTLPSHKSILQHQLEDLVAFTRDQSMVINNKKTKAMPFINSAGRDFLPQLTLNGVDYLEVIHETKLVGMVISHDMKWDAHIHYTVTRVNKILWQLTRFKQTGIEREKLVTFYTLKIRSILMFGAVCYHSALTLELRQMLELQQKRSLAIILGPDYISYGQALALTGLQDLESLREAACLKWARKAAASRQHGHLFPPNPSTTNTRGRREVLEYQCKSAMYFSSAVRAMARELTREGLRSAGRRGLPSTQLHSQPVITCLLQVNNHVVLCPRGKNYAIFIT